MSKSSGGLFRVVPSPTGQGWEVEGPGAKRARIHHDDKIEAIHSAAAKARRSRGQIEVLTANGQLQASWSYPPRTED
jgi:hypothetical protein